LQWSHGWKPFGSQGKPALRKASGLRQTTSGDLSYKNPKNQKQIPCRSQKRDTLLGMTAKTSACGIAKAPGPLMAFLVIALSRLA
jgi:hypothetical protein